MTRWTSRENLLTAAGDEDGDPQLFVSLYDFQVQIVIPIIDCEDEIMMMMMTIAMSMLMSMIMSIMMSVMVKKAILTMNATQAGGENQLSLKKGEQVKFQRRQFMTITPFCHDDTG